MDLRFRVLRSVCIMLWPLSWAAALLGGAASVISFRMPQVEMAVLYRWSIVADRIGFASIFSGLALFTAFGWLAKPFTGVNKAASGALKRPSLWQRGVWVAIIAVLLASLDPGFRYVHPEGSRWISTGRAGRWEVSAAVARVYLWRAVRMDAAFVLTMALNLGIASWSVLAGIRLVESSGEDLVPKVPVHTRPW